MPYVLDTNTVSAFMKGNVAVRERLSSAPRSAVAIPQPVLAEIAYGIELLPASRRRQMLEQRYELVRMEFQRMDWTDEVTDAFGELKASLERSGQRIEDFDIAIAAHALASDAVLVSANMKHMSRIPDIRLEDWSK
jgi:tRNA(fMet)-specific endonuclease VapC